MRTKEGGVCFCAMIKNVLGANKKTRCPFSYTNGPGEVATAHLIKNIRPAIENVNISLQGDSRSPSSSPSSAAAAHGRRGKKMGEELIKGGSRWGSLIQIAFWCGVNNSIIKYYVWHLLYKTLQIFLSLPLSLSLRLRRARARAHARAHTGDAHIRSVCVP